MQLGYYPQRFALLLLLIVACISHATSQLHRWQERREPKDCTPLVCYVSRHIKKPAQAVWQWHDWLCRLLPFFTLVNFFPVNHYAARCINGELDPAACKCHNSHYDVVTNANAFAGLSA